MVNFDCPRTGTIALLEIAIKILHELLGPRAAQKSFQNFDGLGFVGNFAPHGKSNPMVPYRCKNLPLATTALRIPIGDCRDSAKLPQEYAMVADIVDNN